MERRRKPLAGWALSASLSPRLYHQRGWGAFSAHLNSGCFSGKKWGHLLEAPRGRTGPLLEECLCLSLSSTPGIRTTSRTVPSTLAALFSASWTHPLRWLPTIFPFPLSCKSESLLWISVSENRYLCKMKWLNMGPRIKRNTVNRWQLILAADTLVPPERPCAGFTTLFSQWNGTRAQHRPPCQAVVQGIGSGGMTAGSEVRETRWSPTELTPHRPTAHTWSP